MANRPRGVAAAQRALRLAIAAGPGKNPVVGLMLDGPTANTGALLVLAAVEVWAALRLWQVIRAVRT